MSNDNLFANGFYYNKHGLIRENINTVCLNVLERCLLFIAFHQLNTEDTKLIIKSIEKHDHNLHGYSESYSFWCGFDGKCEREIINYLISTPIDSVETIKEILRILDGAVRIHFEYDYECFDELIAMNQELKSKKSLHR